MGLGASERDLRLDRDYRNPEIELLKRERDRLRDELAETRTRFRRFTKASGRFASSMRGRMGERRRLDLQRAVLIALESSATIEEAAGKMLEVLGEKLERSLGVFWMVEGVSLRCANVWRAEGVSQDGMGWISQIPDSPLNSGRSSGGGLSARVVEEGRAVWVGNLGKAGDVRAEAASDAGMCCGLAFPVSNSMGLIGIVELFGTEEEAPDEGLIRTLAITGDQAAQIIKRKQAEEAQRESEQRFRALISKGADMITVSDRAGKVMYASPTTERVSGYTPEEFIGRHPFDAIHPEDRPRCEEALRRLLDEPGLSLDLQHRIEHKDGGWRWIEGTFTSLFHEPAIGGVVANVRDVTERKRAEEERDRLRMLETTSRVRAAERERISRELHDRVAHDMAVVHQSLQLFQALDASEDSRESERLSRAVETARSALDATRDLASELRRSAAEDSVEDALREFLGVYVPEEIETKFSFDGDESSVPEHVRGQLYLILREAVRNALKHSGCQSMKVELWIVNGSISGSVVDDGCGFEVDGDHEGVGLSSMRERAELLNGSLRLTSGSDEGTKMEVSVPLAHSGKELHEPRA